MPWLRNSEISFQKCESLRSNDACAASPRTVAALGEATLTHPGLRCVLGKQRQ